MYNKRNMAITDFSSKPSAQEILHVKKIITISVPVWHLMKDKDTMYVIGFW